MSKLTYRISPNADWPFPARAFFNAIHDAAFVDTIRALRDGIGASFNDVHCERPGDIQPGDEAFEGARFALFEEEVVVSEDELVRLVRLASEAQKRALPDQAAAIDEVLTGWA